MDTPYDKDLDETKHDTIKHGESNHYAKKALHDNIKINDEENINNR